MPGEGRGKNSGGSYVELIYLLTIIYMCRTGRRKEEKEEKKIIHHVVALSCVSGASCHLWCWFLKAHAAYGLTPLDKGVCQVDYRSFLMVYLLYCLKKMSISADAWQLVGRRASPAMLTFGMRIIE